MILIEEVCELLDIKYQKQLAIQQQAYGKAANLRDMEKAMLDKIFKFMKSSGLIEETTTWREQCAILDNSSGGFSNYNPLASRQIYESRIDNYLLDNYGVRVYNNHDNHDKLQLDITVLRRELKLKELFKKI